MAAKHHITPMGVGGVQHLVERAYRESGRLQFVRELFKNALEAGAKRIEFGPEWQAVEKHGVYRFMIADDGKGMGPGQIEAYLNTFGGGGKPIGDAHENFGVGSKTSTLPWNHAGVVVISWTAEDPDGSLVWLERDPDTGEYGARKFEAEDGSFVEVVEPFEDTELGIDWATVKPDWIDDHGTVVVLLGNTGTEDTYVGKGGDDQFGVKAISLYLNTRVWDLPEDVEVRVQELRSQKRKDWPRSLVEASSGAPPAPGKVDRRWNRRRIRGARYYVEYDNASSATGGLAHRGTEVLADGTQIDWYLWEGRRPVVNSYAHEKGVIAACYGDELYDVKTHHATYRRFGITRAPVREALTLIVRPPRSVDGSYGVYPDTARNSLRIKGSARAGEPLPWDEWGEEFAHNLPEPIVAAIRAAMPASSGTLDDDKWRDRLAERFGSRWKRNILRPAPGGPSTTTAVDPGSKATTSKPRIKRKGSSSGTSGGRLGGPTKGTRPGPTPAKPTTAPGGVPRFDWVAQDDLEAGAAAVFQEPDAAEPAGLVLLNREFGPFVEVVEHWKAQYPDHFADKVEETVQQVYGETMVARVAHSQALARDPNWGQKKVEAELRSPAALTMAALGLVNEDQIISTRLGGLLGTKRKAS